MPPKTTTTSERVHFDYDEELWKTTRICEWTQVVWVAIFLQSDSFCLENETGNKPWSMGYTESFDAAAAAEMQAFILAPKSKSQPGPRDLDAWFPHTVNCEEVHASMLPLDQGCREAERSATLDFSETRYRTHGR